MSRHHVHPRLHRDWSTKLRITNETSYDGRAIRKLVAAALRAVVLPVRGAVRIAYSSNSPHPERAHVWNVHNEHHGSAALGSTARNEDGSFRTFQGLTTVLTLPRDPSRLDVGYFARVILHEALHWKGVDHKDMTEAQLYCSGPTPRWAEGVVVAHAVRAKPDADLLRAKKLAHAETMLARAVTRAKRAETIKEKWTRKVRALRLASAKARGAP